MNYRSPQWVSYGPGHCENVFCCSHATNPEKPASKMQYTVVFKLGEFRLSTTVNADSIGEAVFAATKKIAGTFENADDLAYFQCIPVR